MRLIGIDGNVLTKAQWLLCVVSGAFLLARTRVGKLEVVTSFVGVALDHEDPPKNWLVEVLKGGRTARGGKGESVRHAFFATRAEALAEHERLAAALLESAG